MSQPLTHESPAAGQAAANSLARAPRGGANDRLITAGLDMLRRGLRPTVDLLVAECGGSRTTATAALADLWSQSLPGLLARAEGTDDTPEPVLRAMRTLWTDALGIGAEKAAEALQGERDRITAERSTIETERQEAAVQREAYAARLGEIEASLTEAHRDKDAAQEAVRAARDELQLAQDQIEEHRDGNARLSEQLGHARDELEQLRVALKDAAAELEGERQRFASEAAGIRAAAESNLAAAKADADTRLSALNDTHAAAYDSLKTAYHDSEQRLRVDLDAERTDGQKKSQRIEALQRDLAEARAAAAVAAAEAQAKPKPWRRLKPKPRLQRGTK